MSTLNLKHVLSSRSRDGWYLFRTRHALRNLTVKWLKRLKIVGVVAAFAAIVWFILAVELTLAWNSVSNIYDLGSTGQLIPFIIGVMGLFRVMYLALPDQFEDKKVKTHPKEPRLLESSAVWRYHLRNGKTAKFSATSNLQRRWSFDNAAVAPESYSHVARPVELEIWDNVKPVFPYLRSWSSISIFKETCTRTEQLRAFTHGPIIYDSTGRWQYPLNDGRLQNFYNGRYARRWSFDQRYEWDGVSPFVSVGLGLEFDEKGHPGLLRRLANIAKRTFSGFGIHQHKALSRKPSYISNTSSDRSHNSFSGDLERGRAIHGPKCRNRRWSFDDRSQVSWRGLSISRASSSTPSERSSSNHSKSRHRILRRSLKFFLGIFCCVCCGVWICGLGWLHMRKKRQKRCEATEQAIDRVRFELESAGVEMPSDFQKWSYAKRRLNNLNSFRWARLWRAE